MLEREKSIGLIIDVQGRLARITHESEAIIGSITRLIRGLKVLEVPIVLTEQYPEGLGATVPEISGLLGTYLEDNMFVKQTFSCCGEDGFVDHIKQLDRRQVIVGGIEAHVCVYQTVCDLLDKDFDVTVVADCVSSRSEADRTIALERMRDEGAKLSSVEMVLFELQREASGPRFKELLHIVK